MKRSNKQESNRLFKIYCKNYDSLLQGLSIGFDCGKLKHRTDKSLKKYQKFCNKSGERMFNSYPF